MCQLACLYFFSSPLKGVYGDGYKISHYIGERDIRAIANKEFQVTLSDEELEEVDENIEWDSFNWKILVKAAIEKMLKEEYGYRRAKK